MGATFKIKLGKAKEDGTMKVYIRVTIERKQKDIPTSMFVEKKMVTASGKIKDAKVLDRCDELIRVYKDRIHAMNLDMNSYPADYIIERMRAKEKTDGVDFVSFSRAWCEKHTEIKGMKNYITALNSFIAFMGKEEISCSEVTSKRLKLYEESLKDKARAQSMYPSAIVRLFNEARFHYNDEDAGQYVIKHTLSFKPKKQNVAEKRALTVDEIRAIWNLPYLGIKTKGLPCRRDIAKDCFILSFCLMGMNAVDLYSATEFNGERITYERTKTKGRRADNARMEVVVHPVVRSLVEKYRGKDRVFNFYERWGSPVDFGRTLNLGLKEIGAELGIDDLQFYAARHSMATIAVNDVRINKYIVNDMLCHVEPSMRVTDLYIKKDYAPMNEANAKLLEYVFGNE